MKALWLLALTGFLAGCASVTVIGRAGDRTADGREIVETVDVCNTGWKFLCCLPIASGNAGCPNGNDCRWFCNTVTLQNQVNMLTAEAERVGAREAVDVRTYENEEDVFLFLFLRRKLHTSATLVK